MRKDRTLETVAVILILMVLFINLAIAINYYFIDKCELPDFYLWQTNVRSK